MSHVRLLLGVIAEGKIRGCCNWCGIWVDNKLSFKARIADLEAKIILLQKSKAWHNEGCGKQVVQATFLIFIFFEYRDITYMDCSHTR